MTTKEYLEIKDRYPSEKYNAYEGWKDDLNRIIEFNKNLIDRYPWLKPYNRWTGETADTYDYSYTELDEMPEGWRLAFGDQMVEEIDNELKKFDFNECYKIVQIKEKWGGLRWYDGGCPRGSNIDEIIHKYEELSFKTCIDCGKPAEWISKGWISPYCTDCANKRLDSTYEQYKKMWKDKPEKLETLKRGSVEENYTRIERNK